MESHQLFDRNRLKVVSFLLLILVLTYLLIFPVFIIFLSMYSPAAFPLFASAFTAEEKEPFFKAASLSLASSATCPS